MTLTEKLFSFQGRVRRRDYWLLNVGTVLVLCLVAAAFALTIEIAPLWLQRTLLLLVVAMIAAQAWVSIALLVKRLHDMGNTGAWLLISLLPFGGFALFIWCMFDGDPKTNKYGPSPKAENVSMMFA